MGEEEEGSESDVLLEPESKKPQGSYINWFTRQLWPPIEEAIKIHRFNPSTALIYLRSKYKNPRLGNATSPYDALSRQTLDYWVEIPSMFGKKGFKKDVRQVVERLKEEGTAETGLQGKNLGKSKVLDGEEAVEQIIIDTLVGLRETGQPLNGPLMQSVIRGIVQAEAPHLLREHGGTWEVRMGLATKLYILSRSVMIAIFSTLSVG